MDHLRVGRLSEVVPVGRVEPVHEHCLLRSGAGRRREAINEIEGEEHARRRAPIESGNDPRSAWEAGEFPHPASAALGGDVGGVLL